MDARRSSIAVLLATYNGARYIDFQIRSILDQSWPNWRLYIRDDGSQDGTPAIIQRLSEEFPDRICIFPSNGTRMGADGNFSYLLGHVESDYFMFCDQDDVWLPRKVERSLECMRALEAQHGSETPLLVHTDLRVVDADLNELNPSVWRYGNHNPAFSQRLNRLLLQNMVFGCSILINALVKELACPIPKNAVQYDWWLGLVAVCFGQIGYLSEPTLLYRQHERNSVGARKWGPRYVVQKALHFFDRNGPIRALALSMEQAAILLHRYGDRLSSGQREVIRAYTTLGEQGAIGRRKTLVKYGLWKTGVIRNIGLFLRI